MTSQSWPSFDENLRIKLQKEFEPTNDWATGDEKSVLAECYSKLQKCVYETVKEVVPEKTWIKKNGRVVSEATKELFEKRAQEFQKQKPTAKRRRNWNKTIRTACRNDYRKWVSIWVQKIERADNQGDTKAIFQGVNALSDNNKQGGNQTRPTMHLEEVIDKKTLKKKLVASERIDGPEELAQVWHEFLEKKFSKTELERLRTEFELLPDTGEQGALTREEFETALKSLKNGKAPGADSIPAEVWKNSKVASDALFEFLREVWNKEEVPDNLIVCVFVMIYKNKGLQSDCSKYRAIGLLNHAYKVMSIILLRRLVEECADFFSEWQAGFRSKRGCRDNLLLLRVLYDQVIKNNKKCVVTFIDYSAAFDSISHKFMDKTLAAAGASNKSRSVFRAIYRAAAGKARVKSTDGKYIFSKSFQINRGVIQGDIISPTLFILALDQLVQSVDKSGQGVKCGNILKLRVLGYADDAALMEEQMEEMTERLTKLADASLADADMEVNMTKTFSQHVHERDEVTVTKDEAREVESKYEHECNFCPRRFKTLRGMRIHRASCQHNYGTTDETYELEQILNVFGHVHTRWFLVKWKGHDKPEWERGHLLTRDGCGDSIKEFWVRTGKNPAKNFYDDSRGKHRCTVCAKEYSRSQDLKAHRTRARYHDEKTHKVTATAKRDAKLEKRKDMQKRLPRVKWGDREAKNA